jgi:hypothetical protein
MPGSTEAEDNDKHLLGAHDMQRLTGIIDLASKSAQVNAFNDYRKPTSGPFAETYNSGWRNHPNFSWKQNQPQNQGGTSTQAHNQYPSGFPSQAQNQFRSSHQAQPPAFQSTTQVPQPEPQLSFEDTIKAFIQASSHNI